MKPLIFASSDALTTPAVKKAMVAEYKSLRDHYAKQHAKSVADAQHHQTESKRGYDDADAALLIVSMLDRQIKEMETA